MSDTSRLAAIRQRVAGERNQRAKRALAFATLTHADELERRQFESMALDDIEWLLAEVEKQRVLARQRGADLYDADERRSDRNSAALDALSEQSDRMTAGGDTEEG